ncbi:MAG: hypothetical protein M1812_004835 [Candelaria pacifica]|nr:MAG: hypothetical protein M1812_004835 [Candelaria pacifica]
MARQPTTSQAVAATTKVSRRSPTPADNSAEDEGSPEESQGSDDQDTIKLAKAMMESSKKRREAKRKAIELEHRKRVEEARVKITKFMDNEKQKSINVRKAHLERLGILMQRKALLETKIVANIRVVETAYFDFSDEVTVIWKGRLEDLG